VMKIDGIAGTVTWVKQNNTFNLNPSISATFPNDTGHAGNPTICVDASGTNIFVAYQSNVYVAPSVYCTNIVTFKLDGTGTMQWITYDNAFNANNPVTTNNYFPSICTDKTGAQVYLSYSTTGAMNGLTHIGTSPYTQYDIVVAKLNGMTGATLWARQDNTFNNTKDAQQSMISTDKCGQNIFVTYHSNDGTITGGTKKGAPADVIVFMLDQNGNTVWCKQSTAYNTTQSDTLPTISVDASGEHVYVTYSTRGVVDNGITSDGNQSIPFSGDIVVFKLRRDNGQCGWDRGR